MKINSLLAATLAFVLVAGLGTPAFAGLEICPTVFDPVCGVDGNTYGNECEAEKAGVEIAHKGACVDVGGEFLQLDTTSLLLAGAQSFSWMIPVVLSVLGIGLFVVSRKSENS